MAAPRFKQFVEWLRTTTGSTPDESIERLVQKFDDAYVGETAKERLLEAFPELRASKAASSLSGISSDPKNIQVLAHLSDEQIKDQIRRIRSLIAGNLEGIATPSSLETETCGAIRTLVLMIEERVDRNGVEALKPLGLTEEELAAWELRVRAAEEAQGPKPRAS